MALWGVTLAAMGVERRAAAGVAEEPVGVVAGGLLVVQIEELVRVPDVHGSRLDQNRARRRTKLRRSCS